MIGLAELQGALDRGGRLAVGEQLLVAGGVQHARHVIHAQGQDAAARLVGEDEGIAADIGGDVLPLAPLAILFDEQVGLFQADDDRGEHAVVVAREGDRIVAASQAELDEVDRNRIGAASEFDALELTQSKLRMQRGIHQDRILVE